MRLSSLVALVSAVALSAACTNDSLDLRPAGTESPSPTGTETPDPSTHLSVAEYFTLSGGPAIVRGECAGLVFHDESGGFTAGMMVTLVDADGADIATLLEEDGDLEVTPFDAGIPALPAGAGDYPCVRIPLDPGEFPLGLYSARFDVGVATSSLAGVVAITDAPVADLGPIPVATSSSLATRADLSLYRANTAGVFSVAQLGTTASNRLPFMLSYAPDWSEYAGDEISILPGAADFTVMVIDENPSRSTGFDYSFGVKTGVVTAQAGDDVCLANPPFEIATGELFLTPDLATAAKNYDPNSSGSCDVNAPGKDVTYRVHLLAGETLTVAAASPDLDVAIYLLPATASCVATPNDCDASDDFYGRLDGTASPYGSGTDWFSFENTDAVDHHYHLVIDDFDDSPGGVVFVYTRVE